MTCAHERTVVFGMKGFHLSPPSEWCTQCGALRHYELVTRRVKGQAPCVTESVLMAKEWVSPELHK